jgi:Protein of unknown function (DUF3011)
MFAACFDWDVRLLCGGNRRGMTLRRWMFLAALLYLGVFGVRRAAAQSGTTYFKYPNITCASDDMRRHYCRIDTQGRVRMVNQRSGSPCIQGQTWGFDNSGIWVDRGCRADFVVGRGGGSGYYPPPPPPGGAYRPPPPPPPPPSGTITCSSNNMKRNFCSVYTGRGVRLVYQRSGSACIQGDTWGWNSQGIWVDRGCRADFQVNR